MCRASMWLRKYPKKSKQEHLPIDDFDTSYYGEDEIDGSKLKVRE